VNSCTRLSRELPALQMETQRIDMFGLSVVDVMQRYRWHDKSHPYLQAELDAIHRDRLVIAWVLAVLNV
jgi:hypothetical protein